MQLDQWFARARPAAHARGLARGHEHRTYPGRRGFWGVGIGLHGSRVRKRAAIPYPACVIPPDLVPLDCAWPVLLGIDPGTRVAGYGAVVLAPDGPRLVACGVISTPAKAAIAERLGHLQGELELLLTSLRPRILAIESAFVGGNVHSALRIGEARGVVMACAGKRAIEVAEYAPSLVKKVVTGNGQASKEQLASMVKRLLNTADLDVPLDATDALGVALTHAYRSGLLGPGVGAAAAARRR